jgi:hypothetical protein
MIIYLILSATVFVLYPEFVVPAGRPLIVSEDPRRRAGSLWVLHAILISVVVGLRSDVGTDYESYVELFESIRSHESIRLLEPGYFLLNSLVSELGFDSWLVFLAAATTTFFLTQATIARYSEHPAVSALGVFGMGFFFFSLSGVRQALAIAIVFYAFRHIDTRDLLRFLLAVVIAAMFHWTALLSLPAYWFAQRRFSRTGLLIATTIAIVTLYIEPVRIALIELLAHLIPGPYGRYLGLVAGRQGAVRGGYFVFAQVLFLVGIVLAYPRLWHRLDASARRLLNLTIVGFVLAFLLGRFYTIVRVSMYYKIFELLLYSSLIRYSRHRWLRILVALCFILVFLVMTVVAVASNSYESLPYRTIFS